MSTYLNAHLFQPFPGLTDAQRVCCGDVERGRLGADDSGSKGGHDRAPSQLQELAVSIFGGEHLGCLTAHASPQSFQCQGLVTEARLERRVSEFDCRHRQQ